MKPLIADQLAGMRNQPLRKKILRVLFMPEFKISLQSAGLTHRAFLSVIASMFIQSGLLPYNHPARTMTTMGDVGLRDILGEAWFNLRNRRGMDVQQYGLFFSFLLLFSMATMMGILMFSQLLIGTAKAAASVNQALFSSPNEAEDLGLWIINELIANDMATAGSSLGNMFATYSYGVLVIASFIVAWSIISIVVDTAHTGKFFGGRHNPVWWPIRLVFALGILVPLGTGFNAGQYMVVQLAKWGSNFASQAWLSYLSGSDIADKVMIIPPKAHINSGDLFSISQILTCVHANNNYEIQLVGGDEGAASASSGWIDEEPDLIPISDGFERVQWANDKGESCGAVDIPIFEASASASSPVSLPAGAVQRLFSVDFPTDLMASIYTRYREAYVSVVIPAASEFAKESTDVLNPFSPNYGLNLDYAARIENLSSAATATEEALQAELDQVSAEADSQFRAAAIRDLASRGWASAPLFYHYIAGGNDKMQREANPKVAVKTDSPNFPGGRSKQIENAQKHMAEVANKGATANPEAAKKVGIFGAMWNGIKGAYKAVEKGISDSVGAVTQIYDFLNDIMKTIGEASRINPLEIMGKEFGKFFGSMQIHPDLENTHPLAAMSALGAGIINAWGFVFVASLVAAGFTAGATVGVMGAIAANAWVILNFITAPALLAGVILHVVVPMLPFIRFVFAVSGWIIAIVEAIVAVPIVAIGHLRTDGEGLLGPMLQGAYIIFMQLLFRPILILIGLIISINIVHITSLYVNSMYFEMTKTLPGSGWNGAADLLPSLIRSVSLVAMYSVIMYALVNSSFKIMDLLPEVVGKYLGAGQGGMQDREGDNLSGAIVASSLLNRGLPGFKGVEKKGPAANTDGRNDNNNNNDGGGDGGNPPRR